jgi:hypothetical protein
MGRAGEAEERRRVAKTAPRKLPPMSAVEFAIEQAFRRFFFGLRLILTWAVLCLPLLGAVYYLVLMGGMPQMKTLQPVQIAALAILGLVILLAAVSIMVNWNRLILEDERPRGLGWIRLDGAVWKYLWGLAILVMVIGLMAGLSALTAMKGPALLQPNLAGAAKPAATGLAGVLGFLALFFGLRLMTRLPAIAVGDRKYGFASAWRATRRNSLRYLGFLFWLVFGIAIAGAIGAAAVYARRLVPDPYVSAGAIAAIVIIGLWCLFVLMSVPASHYAFFGKGEDFPDSR